MNDNYERGELFDNQYLRDKSRLNDPDSKDLKFKNNLEVALKRSSVPDEGHSLRWEDFFGKSRNFNYSVLRILLLEK